MICIYLCLEAKCIVFNRNNCTVLIKRDYTYENNNPISLAATFGDSICLEVSKSENFLVSIAVNGARSSFWYSGYDWRFLDIHRMETRVSPSQIIHSYIKKGAQALFVYQPYKKSTSHIINIYLVFQKPMNYTDKTRQNSLELTF